MSVVTLNAFDLYFFAPLAQAAIKDKEAHVDRILKVSIDAKWRDVLAKLTTTYRERVETLLKEEAETSDARVAMDRVMVKVATWRRLVESVARQAPEERRNTLLQASGYGLGSPRSAKEMRDFVLEVKQRMELHGKELQKLGLRAEALELPAEAQAELEKGAANVARETAEDGEARARLNSARRSLVDALRSVELAVSAAAADSELYGNEKDREAVTALEIALAKALAESRVQARQKAQEEPVPADLMVEPVAVSVPVDG